MIDTTSIVLYISTFDCRALDAPVTSASALAWLEEVATAGLRVPLYIVHDLGALISYGKGCRLMRARDESAARIEYVSTIKRLIELVQTDRLAERKLPDNVTGQLIARLLKGIKFTAAADQPPLSLMQEYIDELYAKKTPLDIAHWETIYPSHTDLERIMARWQQLDIASLERAGQLGAGTQVKPERLGSLMSALMSLPEGRQLLSLVMRLMPLVNLTNSGAGSQPFTLGGYNDIARHGDLNSILISELAYPQEEFLRRFVENELLYYKREAPPQPRPRDIYYVLDGGPLMWVMSRLLGIAGAIAVALNAERRKEPFHLVLGSKLEATVPLKTAEDLRRLLSHRTFDYSLAPTLADLQIDTARECEIVIAAATEFGEREEEESLLTRLNARAAMFVLQCCDNNAQLGRWQAKKFNCLRSVSVPRELIEQAIGAQREPQPVTISAPRKPLKIGHLGKVAQILLSPDGSYLATVGEDQSLRLWAAHDGEPLWYEFYAEHKATALAFSELRNWLAIACDDGTIRLRETPAGATFATINVKPRVRAIAFTSDDRYLACANEEELQLWQLGEYQKPLGRLSMPGIHEIFFTTDGNWLIVSQSQQIRFVSLPELRISFTQALQGSMARLCVDQLAVVARDRVSTYEYVGGKFNYTSEYKVEQRLPGAAWQSQATSWLSPNGEHLLILKETATVAWHSLKKKTQERIFSFSTPNRNYITHLTASAASRALAVAMADGTLEVKRWVNGETIWRQPASFARGVRLSVSANGMKVCVSDEFDGAYLWDNNRPNRLEKELAGNIQPGEIKFAALSAEERYLAIATSSGAWLLKDRRSPHNTRELIKSHDIVMCAFAPDSSYLVMLDSRHTLNVFDTAQGKLIARQQAIPNGNLLSLTPTRIAFLHEPDRLAIYDLNKRDMTSMPEIEKPLSIQLSPDGQRISVINSNGNYWVWIVGGKRVFTQLLDLKGNRRARILDASRVATFGRNSNLTVINRTTGKESIFGQHLGGVADCLCAGNIIISADRCGRVRGFDKNNDEQVFELPSIRII